jgi:F0F1-type ATP synthase membrane subunit c/vacuolar-type H+-ATPase subunit K
MTLLIIIGVALVAWCLCALGVGVVVGRSFALGSRAATEDDDQEHAATTAVPATYEV